MERREQRPLFSPPFLSTSVSFPLPCEDTAKKEAVCKTRSGMSPEPDHAHTFIWHLQSQNCEKFLLFKPPKCMGFCSSSPIWLRQKILIQPVKVTLNSSFNWIRSVRLGCNTADNDSINIHPTCLGRTQWDTICGHAWHIMVAHNLDINLWWGILLVNKASFVP